MARVQLTRALRRVPITVGFGIALVLATSSAAQGVTATDSVEVSNDAVSYAATLNAPIFSPAPVLVPMQSAADSFWVRNSSDVSVYLRITLEDSSWSSWEYGSAVTVTAGVPSKGGAVVGLEASPACTVILYGVLMAPGDSLEVTATMALGDLDGKAGQASWAAADFGVTLIESAGLDAAADCGLPTTPVVVVQAPAAAPRPHDSGLGSAPVPDVIVPADTDKDEADPQPVPDPDDFVAVLTNTLVNFDSGMVQLATGSIPLGVLLYFLVAFGRRVRGRSMEESDS